MSLYKLALCLVVSLYCMVLDKVVYYCIKPTLLCVNINELQVSLSQLDVGCYIG